MNTRNKILATALVCVGLTFAVAYRADTGRLIDLESVSEHTLCETVADARPWYIITIPVDGDLERRRALGVYHFGERLPHFFYRKDGKIIGTGDWRQRLSN